MKLLSSMYFNVRIKLHVWNHYCSFLDKLQNNCSDKFDFVNLSVTLTFGIITWVPKGENFRLYRSITLPGR